MIDSYSLANVMILLTCLVAVVCFKSNWQCSVALIVSLLAARGLSYLGVPEWHFNAMFLCAFICIWNFNSGRIGSLDMESNEVNYAVAFIYMVRMLVGGVGSSGLVGLETVWLTSTALLLLQNLLVLGGCVGGYSRHFNACITRFRYRADALFFSR